MSIVHRYGVEFDTDKKDARGYPLYDNLGIELFAVRRGIEWMRARDIDPFEVYQNLKEMIWPELDSHRWANLCRDVVIDSKISVLMGCASSGKTHSPAWVYLLDYWANPHETCVLVSSNTRDALRKRVWAEISMLWDKGIKKFPQLGGNMLDSATSITTDSIKDCEPNERKIRDMRKGIFGIACVTGGKFVGLSRYVGIKQKHMRLIADEAQFMQEGFLSAFANLNNNEDFKATVLGNPNDILDPLGKAAEPKGGWSEAYLEPSKTAVWQTRFMNGRCVNLVGTDSPNFDFPADQPDRYPYLISQKKIAETLSFFPKDSVEYYSQCLGVMKIGTVARRVLTRELVDRFGAKDDVAWKNDNRTKIYFVDASYGGDRCVGGYGEFGECVDGKVRLMFGEPKIIPIRVGTGLEPEDQIARFVKQDCEELKISPDNMGHDATGRGALGTALAREWSPMTHPIDSGGKPTSRPVNSDISIMEEDKETGEKKRRLLRCDEHYDRLVTEFWFSVRYAVEADQVRGLRDDVIEELCARKWDKVKGDKKSVEIKDGTAQKPGMKQRFGRSPDLGDWAAGIVEMARRKGFMIDKLSGESKATGDRKTTNWYRQQQAQIEKFHKSRQLQAA